MTPQQFEAAYLAQTAWRLAQSDSSDELVAICCVIRNHVIPKMGFTATYRSYPKACFDFLTVYPVRDFPNMTEDALISPGGLLSAVEDIYDCKYPDITATQSTPGALYFARSASVPPEDWRQSFIHRQLLGTFGSQQFYA